MIHQANLFIHASLAEYHDFENIMSKTICYTEHIRKLHRDIHRDLTEQYIRSVTFLEMYIVI